MKYIALLRGINVGGHRKVEMKKLKKILEFIGYFNVSTYLNSGNALFESTKSQEEIQKAVTKALSKEFGFEIPTLIKNIEEIKHISSAIPEEWQNNKEHKTDVAYLFPEVDSKKILGEIPVKKDYVNLIYVKGAIIWHMHKKNYNKSHLNKLIGTELYQRMTVRNVNTARYLATVK